MVWLNIHNTRTFSRFTESGFESIFASLQIEKIDFFIVKV